jgi:hypothetical protein
VGRQVNAYFDPVDANEFLGLARGEFDAVLLPSESPGPQFEEVTRIDGGFFGAFCRRVDWPAIKPRYVPQQGYWVLDIMQDVLVDWWVPREHADSVGPGRLYYKVERLEGPPEGLYFERKDEGFIGFAELLFRRARKWAPMVDAPSGRQRVAAHALARVRAGRAVLF